MVFGLVVEVFEVWGLLSNDKFLSKGFTGVGQLVYFIII